MLDQLTAEQLFLVRQAMAEMDSHYDEEMHMLWNVEDGEGKRHSTRGSAHYAVGLLIRNGAGDLERACAVLNKVLELQLDRPDEVYHGTFKTSPEAAEPPAGGFPWKSFGPGFAYYMTRTLEAISDKLADELGAGDRQGKRRVEEAFSKAARQVIPTVWQTYDPNWREFIASAFAVILEHFEQELPGELAGRMDEAMKKAVAGSIDRRLSDAVPMNTNIELMHLFIVHYYGCRYGNEAWIRHSDREAARFLEAFAEFGTVAEFNSTTYYGVDLTVLGMIRKYARTVNIRAMGHTLEQGLWENIALFYNPHLENMAGPYARAYEMEMTAHSSLGVFLYLAFGESFKHLAGVNCETGHDPMIALVGAGVPEHVKPMLLAHKEDRLVTKRFRELCERDQPGENRFVCTATAWIERNLMIGALTGSRNTNGQLHPATIHWQNDSGGRYYLRLIRREPEGGWNTHLRGYFVDAEASRGKLTAAVTLETGKALEVCFEVCGPKVFAAGITPAKWVFPGLSIRVEANAPEPLVRERDGCVEIVYPYRPGFTGKHMDFKLELQSGD
ncbi:hypothetical protein GNQ08_22895 [Paenibacillus macerans]|uniref:Uncharacterized protein n=1 Tax=Paenibacillus macerans TaxID=44252 RepID=A0A6N8EZL3_PAEMA|nr:hypothetical protein [Paenibacillus macerans]MUG25219.1 hypothetical protein [Paenibacillus macerans]